MEWQKHSFRWNIWRKSVGIQFFFLVFLSFWTVCAYPKLKQQQKIRFRERLALLEQKKPAPVLGNELVRFWESWFGIWGFVEICGQFLGKSNTDFGEIRHRFWGNQSPDFEEISQGLWENQPPILEQTCCVFDKNWFRFRGNPSLILGKSATDFGKIRYRLWGNLPLNWGKSVTDFGEIPKLVRFGGKLVWFLDWLGTKPKSHCFER